MRPSGHRLVIRDGYDLRSALVDCPRDVAEAVHRLMVFVGATYRAVDCPPDTPPSEVLDRVRELHRNEQLRRM